MSDTPQAICAICGQPFTPRKRGHIYCSHPCAEVARKRQVAISNQKTLHTGIKHPPHKPATASIADVAKAAADAGLTYGQYMAAHKHGE